MTISNSGSDERGRITGGSAGDQTGGEWRIRSWYQGSWNVVLRHPDKNVREMIASMAEAAAKNDKVGYDQAQRHTFWNQLTKVGYKPEKITTKCEADCSAGVAAIVKGAGYRLGNSKMKALDYTSYTGNLKSRLKNAGFTALTASKYLTSDKYLLRGDILLNESRHTCINLTTGSKADASVVTSSSDTSASSKLTVDGIWGESTTLALQNALNAPYKDGEISRQSSSQKKYLAACTSGWEFKSGTVSGSQTIELLQKKIGMAAKDQDGVMGTATVKALQKYLGVAVDGKLDKPSACVKELQRRLNAGTF